MLALSSTASKAQLGSIRPAASCRISRTAVPVRRLNAPKSRRTLRKLGSGTTSTGSQEARDTALQAAPGDQDYAINERSAALAKRAAAIASKLIQQREQAGAAAQTTKTPLDKSLTSLLTSLLSTLADATTNTTPGAPGSAPSTPSPGTNHSSATNAPGRPTPGPTGTPDGLVQLLTQWADEFLASEGTLPDVKEISGSSPADPADMAKTLFMQLLAELLPPTDSSAPAPSAGQYKDPMQQQQQQQPSLGRGLLAATAAAFTAREAASRLQQRLQAEGSRSTDNTWSVKPAVKRTAGSTTGSFDPDAWEAAARAAAEAADAETDTPTITPDIAAAAVASSTRDFSPDAWELAAAAAAAAAVEDERTPSLNCPDHADSRLPLPSPCWVISTLSEALQAATAAAMLYRSRSGSTDAQLAPGTTGPSVQQLLLLPASKAVQQLLRLSPVDRAGRLLLLCGAEQPAPLRNANVAAAAAAAGFGGAESGFGSRGDAWLLVVLEGVGPELGLVEMGVMLAAAYNKYGEDVFLRAARILLPLTDATDPSLTLAPATTPPPAAALQALLLHWLLAPQLAAVGLPLLPERLLLQLLPQVVSACNLRQVTQAAKWGALWPLTQLQNSRGEVTTGMPASSSSSGRLSKSDWQLTEPQVESVVMSSAWCGFTGVPMPWLAHVAAAAAAKLVHGTSGSSVSSSAQLSQGAAAATNDARAVLNALIRGLEPAEPLLVLLMQAVQLLQPGLAGVAAGSTAEGVWKQQLQQLLQQAYSGTGLAVVSHADVIHRSLCCMWKPGSAAAAAAAAGGDGKSTAAAPHMQQQQVLDAAAAVLNSLPPEQLQQELHVLLSLHQEIFKGQAGKTNPHTAALDSILAATAAAADADQAAAMLAALPMPFWADAWATFVSPAAGCFCWTRQQLVAQLQAVLPSSTAAAAAAQALPSRSSSSSSWDRVKAAWEVVAAHFNLQAVVQEVSTRPKVPAASPKNTFSSSSSSKGVDPSKPFDISKPYSYKPGVPFVGDGWDQADDDSSPGPDYVTPSPTPFSGSLGVFVSEVLSRAPLAVAAKHVAALAEVLPAQAFARVAAVLVPRLVSTLDNITSPSSSNMSNTISSGISSGYLASELHSLAKGLLKLYGTFPEVPEAPYAMQLLATAAPNLPLDRLPDLLTSASVISTQLKQMPWVPRAQPMTNPTYAVIPGAVYSDASFSEWVESTLELTPIRQLELVVAAAASGRDGVALQHMLAMLVRQLPLREAHVAFRVLQGLRGAEGARHQQLPYDAVEEASSVLRRRCDEAAAAAAAVGSAAASAADGADKTGSTKGMQDPKQQQQQQGSDREVVWQLGQSAAAADTPAAARAALGDYVQGWDSPWNAAASSSGGSSGSSAADRELIRKLAEVVAEVPAAPPAGSWPMDAMHSPSYTAPLLKRILALLVDWDPSCPAAAALAAQQLNTLATKRAWTAAEASAFLQRLPLHTALQLLLESDNNSSSSSSSSSRRKLLLVRLRAKLLRALADWQGGEAVVQGLRELLVGYSGLGVVSFVEVLSDLKLALSGPAAAAAADAAPNAYVAAVLTVLEVLLPPTITAVSSSNSGSSGCDWSQKLARILAQVSLEVPDAAIARLAEQIGCSFADSQQKPGSTAATAAAAWQADIAALLAALPIGQDVAWDWVPVATAIATAVAETAGSTAVLSVIRYTFQAAGQLPDCTARSAWGAELATVLGQLQAQGVLTCGVAYTMNTLTPGFSSSSSSSGSLGGRFPGKSESSQTVPSCISMQLQQLLCELYHTDRAVSLQQAAAALLSVQEGLGKVLPMAVATVLGGGKMLGNARGYQALYRAMGTDCAEAAAALDAATADVVARFQPTAAALPAAVAAAAKQLSEALAKCHELLPEETMIAVMAAVAAVLPWTDVDSSSSSSRSSSGSSSSGVTCPAELAMIQGGWSGVTQVLLITSSLLTASCRVWGVDKGTQVAASLIEKLTTPAAAATAAETVGRPTKLPRSKSAGEMQGVGFEPWSGRFRRSTSTGSLSGLAFSSSSSSSHAARAEAALFRATSGEARPGAVSHAEGAAAKMRAAAATGGTAQAGSHADRAGAALLHGASSSSSGSRRVLDRHASRAEGKLLHAAIATGGEAVPGSHAAKATAALLQAAATGLSTPKAVDDQSAGRAAGRGADCHAQHAQHALLQALASGHAATAADVEAPAAAAAVDAEVAAWGTDQLLSAADAWYWPGLTTAKGLVHGILYRKYYGASTAAAAAVGTRRTDSKSVSKFDVLPPCEAATALAAALPRLATDLPHELTAEVLGQIWGLVASATWTKSLNAASAAVAAKPAAVTGTAAATAQPVGGTTEGVRQLQQLLQGAAVSLQQQLEPSRDLPAAYAGLLCAAASKLPEGGLLLLLQQMLAAGQEGEQGDSGGYGGTGFGSRAASEGLTSEGVAQLLLELARPGAIDTGDSSSCSAVAAAVDADQEQQLALVATVASAVCGPCSTGGSSGDITAAAADVAGALAGRLYQADVLPRTYLTLLLQPYLSTAQCEVCVKQLGLTTGGPETTAAVAALKTLCNTLNPGRKIPLASYALVLAAALDATRAQGFTGVGFTEARVGLELERQHTLQLLLTAVVHVLGTFRGVRKLYTSPLGAQIVLPMHDLAAVLCYSWQLLPAEAATALAEAVAAALGKLDGHSQAGGEVNGQLTTVLQLLPNAAAEGFGKGPELWRPLLHVMAVAGGLSEPQESSLTQKLLAVSLQQQVPSYPLRADTTTTSSSSGSSGGFADPAAVTAALSGAAAVNDVGLSAGRVSRGTAGGHTAAQAAGAADAAGVAQAAGAADAAGVGGKQQQQQQQQEEEKEDELTEADAALLTTAAAAYLCAALTGFTPLVVFMGSMSTLLVAALGATQTTSSSSSSGGRSVSKATNTDSSVASGAADSTPASPRTPTTTDTFSSSSSSSWRHAAMGGRTKVTFAEPAATAASTDAGAVNYGAATAATAAAAVVGTQGGVWALGSLAVDPDDVIKKIKGHAAQLPLDEALMEVVPLLLLPADASSYTWPLLALSAILHSKFPRLHTLLGPGGASLTNMALAATFVNPDGPLAAVMNASQLLAESDSSSSSSSSRDVGRDELRSALAAAEGVHPHAVAMQLAERLLNALWAVLSNSATAGSTVAGSTVGTAAGGTASAVSTPEGAAAVWQEIAVHLLTGVEGQTAVKLLSAFAHRQQANWEAQLRALAVAAVLHGSTHSSSTTSSSRDGQGLLAELLGQVCGSNSYPPLSFLSLLLHYGDVPLSSSDTAAVLDAAYEQLTASYSTLLPQGASADAAAGMSATSSSSSSSSSSGGVSKRGGAGGDLGVAGDFDNWAEGLLADQGLVQALSSFSSSSSSSGPHYRATSSFTSSSSNSSGGSAGFAASRAKVSPVPQSALSLVESLVKGACARGHAVAALRFLNRVLGVTCNTSKAVSAQGGTGGAVLVVERMQEQQLLQLVLMAVDSSLNNGDGGQVGQPSAAAAAAAASIGGDSVTAASTAAGVVVELIGVLGDAGHLHCVNATAASVCKALAEQHRTGAVHSSSSSSSSSWPSAEAVGQVLTSAAEAVRKSEGVLSAAKPAGGLLLSTAADALFGDTGVSVEQCLVLLSAVAVHMPERLGLQIVAAAAGRLHSVVPQAVGVVRQVAVSP